MGVWQAIPRRHEIVGVLQSAQFTLFEIVGNSERQLLRISSEAYEFDGNFDAILPQLKQRGLCTTLRLGSELGLRRLLTLPAAARNDLHQLLHFEMDRLSPFAANRVYFAHRILRTLSDDQWTQVEVHIVPRTIIDRALATCRCLGLKPKRIELAGAEADPSLNLLPQGEGTSRRFSRLDCALAVLAFLFVGIAAVAPLLKQRATAVELERRVVFEKSQENSSLELRQKLASVVSKIRLIDDHINSVPPITHLVAELTRLIHDDAYLIELHIEKHKLRMRGYGRSASDLVRLLGSSFLFSDPEFLSPITHDPHDGRDFFEVSVSLRQRPS